MTQLATEILNTFHKYHLSGGYICQYGNHLTRLGSFDQHQIDTPS